MIDIANIKTFELATPHGVALVRNRFLRKAWEAQDRAAADQILSTILKAQPELVREHVERLDNAVSMVAHTKAEAYLDEIDRRFPNIGDLVKSREATLLLRSTLRLGRIDAAVTLADHLRDIDGGDAKLGLILMQVYEKAGRVDLLLGLSEELYAKSAERTDIRAKLLSSLIDAGHPGQALVLASNEAEQRQQNTNIVLQIGRAHLKARPTDPRGLELLEDAYAYAPDREDVQIALSKAYLQFGRAKAALEILDIDTNQPVIGRESFRQHTADVFMANDLFAEAGAIYRELARENPLHGGWRRSAIGALFQSGEHSKANALYEEDRMRRRLSANETFEDRLRAINNNLDEAQIPQERFDWAYRKLEQLNFAPADRAAWERACRRVNLADLLTIDWLETRTKDVDQLLARIREPEKAVASLNECLANGKGAFIAGLHMGAMFTGPALLAAHGVDFRWLASTPTISTMPGVEQLISTSSMNRVSIAREVLRSIRDGRAITVAIDGGEPAISRPVSFLGDDILLTDMVPRTIFQTGARSFFPKALWVDDEVKVDIVELIPPEPDDTVESFTSVWFRDFMECVAEVWIEAPDNLRLAGGFWTKVAL